MGTASRTLMPIAFAAALSLGGLPALAKSTKHHHAESASAKHGKSAKASKIASTKAKAAHGKHARAEQAAEERPWPWSRRSWTPSPICRV